MICIPKFLRVVLVLILSNSIILSQDSYFELLPSNSTGITFNNKIQEDISTKSNLFDYDYFYNGAGVGILDINNDGLQDIYFAANQESDRLYLNKGNFQFEDITVQSFIDIKPGWSTGVSIVDINNDGFQDIYVCRGGACSAEKRKNLLFINNKDNTFKESAEKYGLADQGISTQAVFFDYDKDGDLDCFVMNESIAYGLDPISFARLNLERKSELYVSFSHMYDNENGYFQDKTKELNLDKPTFGLGIKISDFNADGWKDIYISNDYYLPDMLMINKNGAGFQDEIKDYLDQMSFYGMGMDIADINNDGLNDIFVLDMAAGDHYRSKTLMRSMNTDNFKLLVEGLEYPHQYMFNSLQLGSSDHKYRNIAQLAGVASTDWSWSALIEDFDFDRLKDIHVTNGYRRYALDNDFQSKVRQAKIQYDGKIPLEKKRELYGLMPTEKLSNVFYKNTNEVKFALWNIGYENNPASYSNGAAIVDLDNDGDHDLVVNNMDDEAFIYENRAADKNVNNFITIKKESSSIYDIDKVEIELADRILSYELSAVRGYLSSSEKAAFIGLGELTNVETLYVYWSNGEKSSIRNLEINKVHHIKYEKAEKDLDVISPFKLAYFDEIIPSSIGVEFEHVENDFDDFDREILLPYKQSTLGPYVSSSDINGDDLEDLVFSNSAGYPIEIYTQTQLGFSKLDMEVDSCTVYGESGEITIVDIDNNGYADILIPSSGNEWIDSSNFYRSKIIYDLNGTQEVKYLPLTKGSSSKLISIDYDNDGDQDIIECKRHVAQKYPMHAPSHLYKNENSKFIDNTKLVFPDLSDYGMINDILVTDFDNDGWEDVILVGEWSNIRFYKNEKGHFRNVNKDMKIPILNGMWFDVEKVDLNNDQVDDYIFGNLGMNSKYKASKEKPLKIYGHDFDDNGTWDLVLSKMYKDDYVPFRGLECSSQQMPFIQDKFETYDLFAKATIDDVYGSSLDAAYSRDLNTLSSTSLVSNDNGGFDITELPLMAQLFPVLDIEILDINSDGFSDVILSGNIYDTEVETPRLDAGYGQILLNDGSGHLLLADSNTAGLDLSGNIKSVAKLFHKGGNCHMIVATENNGSARTFTLKNLGK
jgi:hypothetical protein